MAFQPRTYRPFSYLNGILVSSWHRSVLSREQPRRERGGNHGEALTLFRALAEQGDPVAQIRLGYMYSDGLGVTQDFSEALAWFELAAEQGDVEAQYDVGRAYELGQGTGQDTSRAAQWFTLAAEQGHAVAQAGLAGLYAAGRGVAPDDTEAYAWAAVAAEQGVVAAVATRDAVAARLTPEALEQALGVAQEYWQLYVVPFRN